MKLLGAREFIKMPTGTFYIPYWESTDKRCFNVINTFKKDPTSLLDRMYEDLHVFGDNGGSMCFSIEEEQDDYIFYYDANVVGDANPGKTLYLVIDECELPSHVTIGDYVGNKAKLSKDDLIRIRDKFVKIASDSYNNNDWAIKELDELSENGNVFVDINLQL